MHSINARTRLSSLHRTVTRIFASGVFAMGIIAGAGSGAAGAPIDLGIDSQSQYTRLIDSLRATEYVREDYIVRMRHPRVVASIASLTAYAQLNPLADEAQLSAYITRFDATIQSNFAGDPDLLSSENFMRALQFTRAEDPVLVGTRTDTGKLAATLLGVWVPDPDNFSATQTRMVRYSQGLATSWQQNPRFGDLLQHGFFGVLPDGTQRPELATVIVAYLEAQGYEPTLGGVNTDARFDGVNQSMGMLPGSYSEYQSVLNQPLAMNPLVINADAAGESLRTLIDTRMNDLALNLLNEPSMVDGQAMAQDMSVVQQLLDEQHAELMETSDERSLLYSTVILLGQSPLEELGDYATQYEQYNAALVLATDNMAEINVGLGVANHLLTLGVGVLAGDPAAAVNGFFGLVSDGIGIADLAQGGSSTPSVDEQIYGQVLALRQQVEDLRIEMNTRFDRIELQLGFMYDQMLQGFNALGNQIGDLQNSVDTILLQMNIVRSQLSRLEAALYGLAQDVLLTDLTSAANTVLDYRDENNIDLAYADQNPSFITGSVDFFTYAINTSRSQAFAGSRDAPTLNLSNAGDLLSNAPIARYINDLAVLPTSFGQAPLAFASVPAPEPWAQAASAYAQLARENPWYFAFRYEQQLENYNSDPQNESLPELDEIITGGEQLVSVGTNARNEAFFDSLISLYKDRTQALQQAVDDVINAQLVADRLRTPDGSATIDLWSQDGAASGDIDALIAQYSPGYTNAFSDVRWWFSPSSINRVMHPGAGLPLLGAKIVAGDNATLASQVSSFEYLYQLDANPEYEHRILWEADVPAPLQRGGFATSPYFAIRYEVDSDPNPDAEQWVLAYQREVDSSMDLHITTNAPGFWYPINLYFTETEDSIYCSSDVIRAGGSTDDGWDAFMTGMPYGGVIGQELVTSVTRGGEFGDFSFLSNGGGCGEWNLTTDEQYDLFRVTPWSDYSYSLSGHTVFEGNLFEYLTRYRDQVRSQVNSAFADDSSAVWQATLELDHAVALINAYIELAAPEAMRQSEIIRSALRAAPGASEIGLRSGDVVAMVNAFTSNAGEHDPRTPGDAGFDLNAIEEVLDARADFLHDEINRALALPQSVPAYVGWMLDELGSVRDYAFELAMDDTYAAEGAIMVDAVSGVMANDTLQEYRTIVVDPGFGLSASHGSVTMNADGSFEYTPEPGFSGVDSFEYRLVGTVIEGMPNPADGQFVSDPASVVIRVQGGACSGADLNGDGILNFFDVSMFLVAYQSMDPIADLTGDGIFNFFDVSSFLVQYEAGCP